MDVPVSAPVPTKCFPSLFTTRIRMLVLVPRQPHPRRLHHEVVFDGALAPLELPPHRLALGQEKNGDVEDRSQKARVALLVVELAPQRPDGIEEEKM